MKRLMIALLLVSVGCVAGALWAGWHQAARYSRELQTQQAAWEAQRAELEAALDEARARQATSPLPALRAPAPVPAAQAAPGPDAQALLDRLATLRVNPAQGRSLRPVLGLLEQLAQIGPPALPAIRQFLASGQDVAYSAPGKAPRDVAALAEGLVPVSLRLALFDVLRQIGGPEAESILAENLSRTRRGLELAYLAHVLEEMAPGKYKDAALAAARDLLAGGGAAERDYLFELLQRFSDRSYVATAQAQLIQADGQVDRAALRYLQQTLGEQSVAVAAQLYQDSRLAAPGSKEPLARLALAHVGVSPQAAQLYHTAILDPVLLPDQKRELVEDLNQDGFSNKKNPTPTDLQIIANRYALTQAYLQQDYVQNDPVLLAAFREADKDLRKMLEKAAAAAAAAAAAGAANPSAPVAPPTAPGK
jgi:hypothetical protein